MRPIPLYRPKERVYIALEDMELGWEREDVDKVVRWWRAGMPFRTMATVLKRDADELTVLLVSLAREGRIKPRKGGVLGVEA